MTDTNVRTFTALELKNRVLEVLPKHRLFWPDTFEGTQDTFNEWMLKVAKEVWETLVHDALPDREFEAHISVSYDTIVRVTAKTSEEVHELLEDDIAKYISDYDLDIQYPDRLVIAEVNED